MGKRKPAQTAATRRTEPDAGRLVSIVRGFEGRPVVVLGDLVADEFVYGDIVRISREAPVPILEQRRTVVVPGGGGNAVVNLRALRARPRPVGVVGRDPSGRRLVAAFREREIDCSGILLQKDYVTPTKSRILAGGVHTRRQQIVRVDRGSVHGGHSGSVATGLRKSLSAALRGAEGLLVADYGYGAATPARLEAVQSRIAKRSMPVLVDSRSRVAEFRAATACTPNQEELELALQLPPLEEQSAVAAAGRKLLRRTGNRAILVTRGARGMCLFEKGRSPVDIPAFGSDEVADVTGAGDTVIAVFTLALLSGAGFLDAARLSNYAAGLVVMKAGTATTDPDELIRAIEEDLTP